ncbi:tetratricopeptide repeat protein [Roseibium sp.]|uniref:tetratricopeptide repeat protein n=1 Tax=Roseibium sp. TaxID=1936156 RepID=UPI003A968FB8
MRGSRVLRQHYVLKTTRLLSVLTLVIAGWGGVTEHRAHAQAVSAAEEQAQAPALPQEPSGKGDKAGEPGASETTAPGLLPPPYLAFPPSEGPDSLAPVDLAYGAFQRGWYITAAVRAKPLADVGNMHAQTLLGVMYEAGLGLKKDPKKAAGWYTKAAEAGDVTAAQQLAQLYLLGNGVPQDKSKAADLFQLAADAGDAAARYNLALLYQEGVGRPQNYDKARDLLRQAAEGNYPEAQYNLALSYLQSVDQNPSEEDANTLRQGAFWMGRAARRGHVEAQLYYGILRFQGKGVVPDEMEGADWFERAAIAGNPVAMNRLARCHASGRGRDLDPVLAIKWHYIARAMGVDDEALDGLAERLDDGTRQEAQRLAEEFTGSTVAAAEASFRQTR